MSAEPEGVDTLTVAAAAVIAWSGSIVLHQVGHAVVADAFGARVETLTALGITARWGALRTPGMFLTSLAGTAVNLLLMVFAWAAMRPSGRPGLRCVLGWLVFVTSGWIVAGHMVLSPVLGAGDWMTVVDLFANRGPLRASTFVTGLFVCGVLWKATHERLAPIVGGGLSVERVRVADRMTRTAWLAGALLVAVIGSVTGLAGPSDAMLAHNGVVLPESPLSAAVWGCMAAFVGYALVTLPIMLAPRMVEERPVPGPPLSIPRSVALLVAACFVAALMIGFVGPGVRLSPL